MEDGQCPKCESKDLTCLHYSESFLYEKMMCNKCKCEFNVHYELTVTDIEIINE